MVHRISWLLCYLLTHLLISYHCFAHSLQVYNAFVLKSISLCTAGIQQTVSMDFRPFNLVLIGFYFQFFSVKPGTH